MSIAGQELNLKRWLAYVVTLQCAILKVGLEEKVSAKEHWENGKD